jgi:hypothetical protein
VLPSAVSGVDLSCDFDFPFPHLSMPLTTCGQYVERRHLYADVIRNKEIFVVKLGACPQLLQSPMNGVVAMLLEIVGISQLQPV